MSEKAPAPFLNLVVADALLRDFGLSINMSATAADKNGALWVSNDEHFGHIYIHRDAARAWQAVHDWLNGTPEQWQQLMQPNYPSTWPRTTGEG